MQRIFTAFKKKEGFVSIETILIGCFIIAFGGIILTKLMDAGSTTSDSLQTSLSHDSSFINERTKDEIINR